MDETIDYYNKNAEAFVKDTYDADMGKTRDVFLSALSGNSILDFGCGSGRDTKYFLDLGYKVDAIDGSLELCKIASNNTGITVKHMYFEDLDVKNRYDGIWACSSILHLDKESLKDVMNKMVLALKDQGVIYTSFKYGDFTGIRKGRYFTYFREDSFQEFVKDVKGIEIKNMWLTGDVREGRRDEQWLNIIMKKC